MINLRHLYYFWTVAKTGSVAAAAERLHLAPQTVSTQVKLLEDSLGTPLLQPAGRRLKLTPAGSRAAAYADEIFALAEALKTSLRNSGEFAQPLRVGISDAVPKNVAYRLLAPVTELAEPVRLVCQEGKLDRLLAELALHRLDVVVADRMLPSTVRVKGYNHRLGESQLAFFAAAPLARSCRRFPACLDGAPMLLPGEDSASRLRLQEWFEAQGVRPRIVGEFDDAALMKAFGEAGRGIFPAPAVLAAEVQAQYKVKEIGRAKGVNEAYYAITAERRISHPALRLVTEAARDRLFSRSGRPD
ncbi:transcriptional activator NhaR [Thiobacter aerophilum]|uniref:Transcriptional activator NhaR n=1 Tax=Thiobacter aerophilum TaxID=3121275 RepID=A0ABV0ECB3_9BURK